MAEVKLRARKYFCDNSGGPRKVFTECLEYEFDLTVEERSVQMIFWYKWHLN